MSSSRIAFVVAALIFGAATGAAAQTTGPRGEPRTPPIVRPDAPPTSAQPRSELLYVPVPTCRIASTAESVTGIFAPSTLRTFYVRGVLGFPGQGGKDGGCGIPPTATAIAVSTTVRSYSSEGNLAVQDPVGTGLTRFSYYKGLGYQVTTPIFALPTAGTEPSLRLRTGAGAGVHLLIDAVGYYIPPISGMINASGGLYSGTSRLISAVRNSTGSYTLTVDRDVTYCTVNAQAYSYGYEAHAYLFNNTTVSVYSFSRGSGTIVAQDDYIYVAISC